MKNEHIDGWVFTYSPHDEKQKAVNRDNYSKLWSDVNNEAVIKSSKVETLIEIITKGQGDLKTILKLKEKM